MSFERTKLCALGMRIYELFTVQHSFGASLPVCWQTLTEVRVFNRCSDTFFGLLSIHVFVNSYFKTIIYYFSWTFTLFSCHFLGKVWELDSKYNVLFQFLSLLEHAAEAWLRSVLIKGKHSCDDKLEDLWVFCPTISVSCFGISGKNTKTFFYYWTNPIQAYLDSLHLGINLAGVYIYLFLTEPWAGSLNYLWKPSYHRLVSSFLLFLALSFAFLKLIRFPNISLRFNSGFAQLFASLFLSLLNWIRVISCARISNIGEGCSVCWSLANYMTKKKK